MKTAIIFLVFAVSSLLSQTTSTVSIRLDSTTGSHANLDSFWPTLNLTPDPDFAGVAWTQGGTPYFCRSLIKYNLGFIDSNATVNSAFLSLFGNPNPLHSPGHSNLSGSDVSYLRRVISDWDQYLVTWNTQPSMALLNQITLPQSTSQTEDYLNIDVTVLVRNMVNHPSTNYGFILVLATEQFYRSLNFASSHCADSTKRPKLVINYTTFTGIQPVSNQVPDRFSLAQNYPNPFNPSTKINFSIPPSKGDRGMMIVKMIIYDVLGNEVETLVNENLSPGNYQVTWNSGSFSSGIYYYRLSAGDFTETKKMVLVK